MTILLVIIAMTFKSWCPYSFGPTILCLVSLLIAFLIVTLVLGFVFLIDLLTPAYISSVSLFTIEMQVGLVFLPLSLLSSTLFDDSPSSVLVKPSFEVSLLDLVISTIVQSA